jgi:hypothetical protein
LKHQRAHSLSRAQKLIRHKKSYTIKLIFVRNPIQADRKEITYVETGLTITEHIAPIKIKWQDTDFTVAINGHVIYPEEWDTLIPRNCDEIVIHPILTGGLSNFLRTVADIAIVAYASAYAASFGANMYTKAILGAIGAYVGGRVANAILPPPNQNDTTTNTYGWNGPQPTSTPGTCVGKTYGTASPTPVLIARFVTTNGSDQYLNLLYSGGEGPVDSIQDIEIDGNPISNYVNVGVYTRLGTNDQSPIPYFNDTVTDYEVYYELDSAGDWSTQQTVGNADQGLQITIEFPYGLAYINSDGSLGSASVTIEAQYQLVGASSWSEWGLSNSGTSSASTNQSMWAQYRLDNLAAGKYNVRVRCTNKSGTSTSYLTRVFWITLSEILYDDFAYPNRVLVGIQALASNQLSSSDPTVTWTQTRNNVYVWNPNTGAYVTQRATSPAWACYDLMHQCKYLKNINTGLYEYYIDGNPYSRIDYEAFCNWALYADEQVNSDNRFNLNIFLSEDISFWDALARLAIVGRGTVFPKGTLYSCICDMPGTSSQLFTVGNIVAKSFKGEFQSLKDRATSIEITFPNKEKNYSNDLAIYYGSNYESTSYISNPTRANYYGITDYAHAYAEAAYLSRCNQYLIRTETWEADVDAMACCLGDIVDVAHDIPAWGWSGRIVSATSTTATLDRTITMQAGTSYCIEVRTGADELFTFNLVAVTTETTTNTVTLATPFTVIPVQYDLYSVGIVGIQTKPFKIVNIAKSGDQKVEITGVEYIAGLYDDSITVPVVNYSNFTTYTITPSVSEQYPGTMDSGEFDLQVSWVWPTDTRTYKATVFLDGTLMATVALSDTLPIIISTKASGSHTVKVNILSSLNTQIGTGNTTYTITPSTLAAVTNAKVSYLYGNATITWDAINDSRLAGYQIMKGSTLASSHVVAQMSQNYYTVSGNDTYWIAGYYQTTYNGVTYTTYSEAWIEVAVTLARVGQNVVSTWDELATKWSGTFTGGAFVNGQTNSIQLEGLQNILEVTSMFGLNSMFFSGGVMNSGSYQIPASHIPSLAQDQLVNITLNYTVSGVDINGDFDITPDVDKLADLDGSSANYVTAQPQINVYSGGAWSGWQNYVQGEYYGSQFNFQILLASNSTTVTPNLSALSIVVDVDTITIPTTPITSASDGSFSVTYPVKFNMVPSPSVTASNGLSGDYYELTSETSKGFSGVWYNSSGVGVVRNLNWSATGY